MAMTTKPYTKKMLARFDRLTNKASSIKQMDRIEARMELAKFVEEHGKDVCNQMFAELQAKHAKARR